MTISFIPLYNYFFQSTQDERFCFLVEWYDGNAAINRRYQFFFYAKDNTIEMVSIGDRILILKPTIPIVGF